MGRRGTSGRAGGGRARREAGRDSGALAAGGETSLSERSERLAGKRRKCARRPASGGGEGDRAWTTSFPRTFSDAERRVRSMLARSTAECPRSMYSTRARGGAREQGRPSRNTGEPACRPGSAKKGAVGPPPDVLSLLDRDEPKTAGRGLEAGEWSASEQLPLERARAPEPAAAASLARPRSATPGQAAPDSSLLCTRSYTGQVRPTLAPAPSPPSLF